jgi:hypothetical protein
MSERGEIEVLLPVDHTPNRQEQATLRKMGFAEANRLAASVGGRVVGLSKVARAVEPTTGQQALRLTFAVDAPESTWYRRSFFTAS